MIDFHFTQPIPALPKNKGDKEFTQIKADGVGIDISIEHDSDTRLWADWEDGHIQVFHLVFRSCRKEPVFNEVKGESFMSEIPNPISHTGYRSKFILLKQEPNTKVLPAGELIVEDFDFEDYLNRYIEYSLKENEQAWENSKQLQLF